MSQLLTKCYRIVMNEQDDDHCFSVLSTNEFITIKSELNTYCVFVIRQNECHHMSQNIEKKLLIVTTLAILLDI